jgi:ABC-type sugar transport system ATPase subunit
MTNLDAKTKALELAIEFHKNQKSVSSVMIIQTAKQFEAFLRGDVK